MTSAPQRRSPPRRGILPLVVAAPVFLLGAALHKYTTPAAKPWPLGGGDVVAYLSLPHFETETPGKSPATVFEAQLNADGTWSWTGDLDKALAIATSFDAYTYCVITELRDQHTANNPHPDNSLFNLSTRDAKRIARVDPPLRKCSIYRSARDAVRI
jgi:hypothetical protein